VRLQLVEAIACFSKSLWRCAAEGKRGRRGSAGGELSVASFLVRHHG
jgi:hypothetical protein